MYKLGLNLCFTDWLPRHSYVKNKDKKMVVLKLIFHTPRATRDIPMCISIEDIQETMLETNICKNDPFIL